MPKGHRAGRETKKQKKVAKQPLISSPIMPLTDVEVIKKKKKTES
jgi:hypothetical protein